MADNKTSWVPWTALIVGVVLSALYVKLGWTPPVWLQPAERAKGAFITMLTSVLTDDNDLTELQREIAVTIQQDPGYYTSIDDALGKFITEEIVWRERTKRTLKLLQDYVKNLDRVSGSDSSWIDQSVERLLLRLPGETREEKRLAYKYLQRRFPGHSDSEIVDELRRVTLSDLFQMKFPSSRVVFALAAHSTTKIDIYDASRQKIRTLIDADLPAGQYRLYWDFTNDDGETLSRNAAYSYKIFVDGERKRTETMETPKSIWE